MTSPVPADVKMWYADYLMWQEKYYSISKEGKKDGRRLSASVLAELDGVQQYIYHARLEIAERGYNATRTGLQRIL